MRVIIQHSRLPPLQAATFMRSQALFVTAVIRRAWAAIRHHKRRRSSKRHARELRTGLDRLTSHR